MNSIASQFPKLILALIFFYGFNLIAQTPEQARKITASYDKAYLQNLSAKSLTKSINEKRNAIEYAKDHNKPISYTTEEGVYVDLQKMLPDGTLLYYTTYNVNAAKSTRVDHLNIGGSTGYDLEGQNMIAHVWDGGHALTTHQEYDGPGGNNRVTIMDSPTSLHYHGAHVIGTIAASGVNPLAKGMAPRSTVKSYDWNNDLSEAAFSASSGMLLSNHSYGYRAEDLPSHYFGAYLLETQEWDDLMFNSPYYLMVKAAGNDGNQTHLNSQPLLPGYDMLSVASTAKNNLVVAAANDANVDSNGNLISVSMSSFSSPGPTDDLRIKPDIAGNGVDVYSTFDTSNTAYGPLSGTSMASPNVTGSLLLLQEHYNNLNSSFMRAATLKGLALHTADDAGLVGPDAIWGWGLLNSKRAAETITKNGSESLIQEMVLTQGQTITLQVDSDGIDDLIASISWTDRPGVVNTQLNSSTPALVNDLDIRVSKAGTTYFPWRLTSATTNSKSGDNKVDPFERVDVVNASGTYTITITHKGTLVGGSQAFSLIVTGLDVECIAATTPQNVNVYDISDATASVSWTPVSGALYDLRYREVGTTPWSVVTDINTSNYKISGLDEYTDYEVEVRSKCTGGSPSAYSTTVNFTTIGIDYCDSSTSSPDYEQYISNVSLNTLNHYSTASTYSDFTNVSTELLAGETYTISVTTTAVSNYPSSYGVWIDYNRNGIFESTERVFDFIGNANDIATGTFTVPSNIDTVSTTMRVSMTYGTTIPGPCDQLNYGEVEDYTIHLIIACDRPSALTATGVSMTTADMEWTAGSTETSWNVSWGTLGYFPGDANELGNAIVSTEFYQITGLAPQTDYEFYVQADCASDGMSPWVGPYDFTTLIDPSSVVIIDRLPDNPSGVISTKGNDGTGIYCADYFTLTDDVILGDLTFYGFNSNFSAIEPYVTGFNVYIYGISNSTPDSNPELAGTGIVELGDVNPTLYTLTEDNAGISEFKINITQANGGIPITLPEGDYWISAFPSVIGAPTGDGRWNWLGSYSSLPSEEPMVIDPMDLFGVGVTDWSNIPSLIGESFPSFSWKMTGDDNGSTQKITCVPSATRNANLGVCQYTVIGSEFDATFTGNGTITNNINGTSTLAGEVLSNGITSVEWTVTDSTGQSESCTTIISVIDSLAPIVSCPSDQLVETGVENQHYTLPDYFASGEATAINNCGEPITNFTQNPSPGTQLPEGAHTITISATGENGSIASCSFELTVNKTLGGINNVDYGTLVIYPIPAKDKLNISNPKNIQLDNVAIYDLTGRIIQTLNLAGRTAEVSLDVSKLSSATYMIVITGEAGKTSKLFVKE